MIIGGKKDSRGYGKHSEEKAEVSGQGRERENMNAGYSDVF
jgi:hypothetical protein